VADGLWLCGVLARLRWAARRAHAAPKDGDRPASWQALRSMGPFLVPLAAILVVRALMLGALTTFLPVFLSEEGATLWRAGAALSVLQAAGVLGHSSAAP